MGGLVYVEFYGSYKKLFKLISECRNILEYDYYKKLSIFLYIENIYLKVK